MKIRSMRWGYDGGGVACGPVEGNTVVEICVTGNDEHNYFVLAMRMMEYQKIMVSTMPLFDILIHSNHYDVDFGNEWEKCTSNFKEVYDYEIGGAPEEEIEKSEFFRAIQVVRAAMWEFFGSEEEDDAEGAKEYISEYVGKKLEEIELPEFEEGRDDYGDFEEDEDDEEDVEEDE